MIVPMLKYSFLVYHQEYQAFLDDIRQLGVVHILEKQKDIPDAIREKYELIRQVDGVLKLLAKREQPLAEHAPESQGQSAFEEVQKLFGQLEALHQQLGNLRKEITLAEPWGTYSREILEKLQQQNVKVRFFTVAVRKFDPSWTETFPIEVINQHAGQYYFVLVDRGNLDAEPNAEEMRAPERPLSELLEQRQKIETQIAQINQALDTHATQSVNAILDYRLHLTEINDYEKVLVHTQTHAEDKVMLLEGWAPQKQAAELEGFLEKTGVVYLKEKPVKEDKVPIMLKNQNFSKKFEMLGELYSLPKYGELDLTPFFAPFYTLFFGFCLGDAGYGILMTIAALALKSRVQKELKAAMGLVFYLGLSTIFFGLIGGTFFGIPLYETSLPVYSTLAARFEAQGTNINNILFYLSLALGAVQILFGMILKAINEIRQYGWKLAVGTLGWITLLIGSISVYALGEFTAVEAQALTPVWYGLFAISGTMILLLNNLTRNVFMNLGVGLWDSYNMITGILGDLLSYIRLFALGISSAILGFVFNSLAVSMSGNIPVLSILIMVVILVIGHSINLFMSGLGSFVHPMRLTFVEFYKNAGFSGGGKKYNPFKKLT